MQQKYKVVILGAGIAGLIAARQLKYFGFEVVVLEARNRLGGRIFTYRQEKNIVADVGAFIITGIGGNPIRVLQKQINFSFQPVNQKCPLYFQKFVIDKSKDEVLETVFNSLLESTSAISNLNLAEDNRMSLGDALDIMVELHERDARQKHLNHLKDIYDLQVCLHSVLVLDIFQFFPCFQNILLKHITDIKGLRESINEMYDKHVEAIQSKTTRNTKQEYAFRQNRHDLFASLERYKGLEKKIAKIEHKIRDLQRYNVPSQYLSSMDRTILDWHFANLEFATGTILKSLSLKYWDQDDEFEFTGPQLFANNGFYQCVYNLVDGEFDVKLNHAVKAVIMTSTGVEVQAVNIEKINANDQQQLCGKNLNKKLEPLSATCFHADAVLCTLPLGVLKSSVAANETEANASVEFSPPLPEYKVKAIKRLGYGNLNKVVMVFEQIFWDKNHMFGHVVPCSSTRGEMFLFCAAYKQPVLIALIAGEVANSIEAVDDETIKSRCLTVLNETFSNVSTLKHFFVTRWKSDPWSQGVYTYVSTESTPDDFDQISQPVLIRSPSETPIPRLFFAGEHTIRKYPATVHGALLSGLREATNIANHFLGISK